MSGNEKRRIRRACEQAGHSMVKVIDGRPYCTTCQMWLAVVVPGDGMADGSDVGAASRKVTGAELIAAERRRQVEAEGYTAEHDAEHVTGEFVSAAMAHARAALCVYAPYNREAAPTCYDPPAFPYWPWSAEYFKPGPFTTEGAIRDLVKAGALIAAEIDRLGGTR